MKSALFGCRLLLTLFMAALALPGVAQKTGEVWAVVAGVNQYPAGIQSLQYPAHDARLLCETLQIPGVIGAKKERLVLLTDDSGEAPTRANILRHLREIAKKAQPQDTVWFYFGGHGFDRNGQSYLAPADIRSGDLLGSALSVREIRNILATACPQGQRILVLDACHSGSPRDLELVPLSGKDAFAIENMVTFAACDASERTWEFSDPPGGIFTYYLTRGLRGAAGRDAKGQISSQRLYAYVSQRVKQEVFKRENVNQTPQMLCKGDTDLPLAAWNEKVVPQPDDAPHPPLKPTKKFAPLLLVALTDAPNPDGGAAAIALETEIKQDLLEDFLIPNREDTRAYFAAGNDRESRQKAAAQAGKRGANYFLTGSVTRQLINPGAAGNGTIDAEIGLTGELFDAQGKLIRAIHLLVTGAGFTDQKALANGIKKAEARLMRDLEFDLDAILETPKKQ